MHIVNINGYKNKAHLLCVLFFLQKTGKNVSKLILRHECVFRNIVIRYQFTECLLQKEVGE